MSKAPASATNAILKQLNEAKAYIENKTRVRPHVAITLGSGLAGVVSAMKIESTFEFSEIPHFVPSGVEGHPGRLLIGHLSGAPVVVLQGRVHFYEGHSMEQVVFATRLVGRLGCRRLLLTNASGGLLEGMNPGDMMIIEDHINLTGQNPLLGPNISELGPRFPDMSEVYSQPLRTVLEAVLKTQKVPYHKGVYCGLTGPTYETPAEVRFLRQIGIGAVGMSTVAEAIAARHMGLEIVGLSCITNVAAGLKNSTVLSHDDVKTVAARVEKQMSQVIENFIGKVAGPITTI